MPVYTSHVGSLLNGVSRQTPQLRLRSQGEDMINGYPTLAKGLGKRPPVKFLKEVGLSIGWTDAKTHWINRDSLERYCVQIKNGDLRVFDLAGNPKTVNFPDGKAYLSVASPDENIVALTVADYTFIVNRTVTAAMDATDVSAALFNDALINIKAGNYSRSYRLIVDGVQVAYISTADGSDRSHGPTIDPVNITKTLIQLATNVTASTTIDTLPTSVTGRTITGADWDSSVAEGGGQLGFAPWSVVRYDNAMYIYNSTSDFTLDVEDGFNGRAMRACKGSINDFTDLPLAAPAGFKIKITGDTANDFDDFWLEHEKDVSDAEGTWKECIAPSTVQSLDAATMPHILVREADGTFTFKKATWEPRKVGDTESCPDPAFVGQTINDVVFFRNRLAIMAGENISLSRAGDYFNFFIETVTTALDTDPIDVGLSTDTVANIYHGKVLSNDLLLFSDQRQLRLTGGDLLKPDTTAIRDLSAFLCDVDVEPIVVGERVYFLKNFGQSTSVREYWVDQQTQNAEELEITNHCPDFIPGGVFEMAGSGSLNMLALLTTQRRDRIYNHHFFWAADGTKPQSAWGYWELPTGSFVEGIEFFDTSLYMLVTFAGRMMLCRMDLEVGLTDSAYEWQMALDFKVNKTDPEMGTILYDATNDWTTIVMPWQPLDDVEVWTNGSSSEYGPGVKLNVINRVGSTVYVAGNHVPTAFTVGQPYTFRWRFSEFFLKDKHDDPQVDGRAQIIRMSLWHADSASFSVTVTPTNKDPITYDYLAVAEVTDDPDTTYNEVTPQDGNFNFPVKAKHDKVTVDIINDSALPAWFISAEYKVLFQPKYRRA